MITFQHKTFSNVCMTLDMVSPSPNVVECVLTHAQCGVGWDWCECGVPGVTGRGRQQQCASH